MAVVISLNRFMGPVDDTVTAQTYYRIQNTEFGLVLSTVDSTNYCTRWSPGGSPGCTADESAWHQAEPASDAARDAGQAAADADAEGAAAPVGAAPARAQTSR